MRTALTALSVVAATVALHSATEHHHGTVTQVTKPTASVVKHHRPQPARTHKLCRNENSTNCFHPFLTREFPAWYAVTVPLTDTHGNDDLGAVECHLYVKSKRPDSCVATGLVGKKVQ